MSASAKKITPLELFVDSYLREHKKINRGLGITHLQDAVKLIDKKLGLICCDNPPTPVSLQNREPLHNQFVDTVRKLLQDMIKKGNVKSLERTKNNINRFIDGCCCTVVTFNFTDGMNPADAQVQIFDSVTNKLLFQTSTTGDTTQTACIPNIYFRISTVKVCMNVINSPFCEGRTSCQFTLADQDFNEYSFAGCGDSGQICQDTNVTPYKTVQPIYNLSVQCEGG